MKAKPLSLLVATSRTLSAMARRVRAVEPSSPCLGTITAMSGHHQSRLGSESATLVGHDVLTLPECVDLVRGPVDSGVERRVEHVRLRGAPDRHLAGDVEPGSSGTW